MGRDEYPITTTSALDLLIRIEGEIWGNQKFSTHKTAGVEEYATTKSSWDTPLPNRKEKHNIMQIWSQVRTRQL